MLEESLPFADERDIVICRHWQTGVRSRLHLYQGRWDAALEDSVEVLSRLGMPLCTLWPLLVSVLVPLRRGDVHSSDETLDIAWQLAESLDEPVRRLPLMSALAERAWMTGTEDDRVSTLAVEEMKRLQSMPGASWAVGELAVWFQRLDLLEETPSDIAEPHRLTLEGRHEDAARWWHDAGDPFQEALSWGDSADPEHQVHGVTLLETLGATGTADRRRMQLRTDGVDNVPSRPRASTRANPFGLTNRQLEVARLLARSMTNAEIATRLYISPKTADHHVSAVLMRMGLPNRRAVIVQAEELGLALGMPLCTLWPLLVSVLVPLRRGDVHSSDEPLNIAWQLAESLDEPVRRLPLMSALAERAWMTGTEDDRVSTLAVEEMKRLQSMPGASWAVGDLAVWLQRLGLLEETPSDIAEPHRLTLEGRHEDAARWWHDAGDPFQEALCWGDSADPEHQVHGVTLLETLGATGTADRRRMQLRTDGVDNVPSRPRASTRANPFGLTNRQLEVARLLARGMTNAEIATRLYISPKTADHHVSAVLMRMGLPNRRAVIVQAEELGLA